LLYDDDDPIYPYPIVDTTDANGAFSLTGTQPIQYMYLLHLSKTGYIDTYYYGDLGSMEMTNTFTLLNLGFNDFLSALDPSFEITSNNAMIAGNAVWMIPDNNGGYISAPVGCATASITPSVGESIAYMNNAGSADPDFPWTNPSDGSFWIHYPMTENAVSANVKLTDSTATYEPNRNMMIHRNAINILYTTPFGGDFPGCPVSISGKVYDPMAEGNPEAVAGATVELWNADGSSLIDDATTDANGYFAIPGDLTGDPDLQLHI
jgi:hypothetical protein